MMRLLVLGGGPAGYVAAGRAAQLGAEVTVVEALPTAKSLRFEYIDVTGAPHDADIDVAGFADLLAWTDRQLGRTTAKPTGVAPRGLDAAPAPSRGELVVRMGVPPRLLAKHTAASDCEASNSPLLRAFKPVIGVLSSTAILYSIPCTASQGNVSYRLWTDAGGSTIGPILLHRESDYTVALAEGVSRARGAATSPQIEAVLRTPLAMGHWFGGTGTVPAREVVSICRYASDRVAEASVRPSSPASCLSGRMAIRCPPAVTQSVSSVTWPSGATRKTPLNISSFFGLWSRPSRP